MNKIRKSIASKRSVEKKDLRAFAEDVIHYQQQTVGILIARPNRSRSDILHEIEEGHTDNEFEKFIDELAK
jgi:hypothetical protein